jgi:RNA 3'-terminal phosphate cyclase (ATP)
MITIDGSHGEGDGQILRSSLALSLVTGQPFAITHIRANRDKPGLLRQHLTAVNAATAISHATVSGDTLGSRTLEFRPKTIQPGAYKFAVGTAGSATLVLQTILPALLTACAPTTIDLEGGTHNPFAPSFDFLDQCFLPLLNRMGPHIATQFTCPGFYPAGGGKFSIHITPAATLTPLELLDRGPFTQRSATILLAGLPGSIAERERNSLLSRTQWPPDAVHIRTFDECHGPGNAITLALTSDTLTEVFTGFGQKGTTADAVVDHLVKDMRRYLASSAPVGEHLADQLLLPLALAGAGRYRTLPLTQHTRTNIEVIQKFLSIGITTETLNDNSVEIRIGK